MKEKKFIALHPQNSCETETRQSGHVAFEEVMINTSIVLKKVKPENLIEFLLRLGEDGPSHIFVFKEHVLLKLVEANGLSLSTFE